MKKVVLSIMAILCVAGLANADLMTYDLRVNPVQTGGATYDNDHHATVDSEGDVVQMTMYAVLPSIAGTANSGIWGVTYSLLSSNNVDTQRGDLANDLYSIFTVLNQDGAVADLDGDSVPGGSDLDIGSTELSDEGYDNGDWVLGLNTGLLNVNASGELAIADVTWTATAITNEGYPDDTIISPYPHNGNGFATAHQFKRDNVGYWEGYLDPPEFSPDALEPTVGVVGVTIACIPEPSTFILLGMGLLALLAFRRRK